MSNLSSKNSLCFLTGVIGPICLTIGGLTARASSQKTSSVTIIPNEKPSDTQIILPHSYSLAAKKYQKLQNLKVHLPEPEQNSPNLPLVEEKMPAIELDRRNEMEQINSLDPEIPRFNQVMQYAIDGQLSDRPLGEIMQETTPTTYIL